MKSAADSSSISSAKAPKARGRAKKAPANGAAGRTVTVVDAGSMTWEATGKEGLSLKTVRDDQSKGFFFGAVAFEPMVRSGVHQHQGVATSFFPRGGLTDYSGCAKQDDVGVNLKGATHDAISYESTLLISRLEGPVTYPEDAGNLHGLHSGAHHGRVDNDNPDAPPDLFIPVTSVPVFDSGVVGVARRTMFDYAGVGDNHRMLMWSIRPNTAIPVFRTEALLELWIHGGDMRVNGEAAHADCFIIVEPGQEVAISSIYGARVFVWIEGPAEPVELTRPGMLFGY